MVKHLEPSHSRENPTILQSNAQDQTWMRDNTCHHVPAVDHQVRRKTLHVIKHELEGELCFVTREGGREMLHGALCGATSYCIVFEIEL